MNITRPNFGSYELKENYLALSYYAKERARWPQLCIPPFSKQEVEIAVFSLARHFQIIIDRLIFTTEGLISTASSRSITLSLDGLTWLVIAHELAHCMYFQHYYPTMIHRRYHGQVHSLFVDAICRYIIKRGWLKKSTLHKPVFRIKDED